MRHAACLLADIGWRAHPDYRGEQSLNLIANAAFIGIDHPGRAFLAIVAAYRHMGPDADVSPQIRALANARMLDRAHILGAAMRLAYVISAAMPGVLPRTPIACARGRLVLTLPSDLAALENERLQNRLRQLARLIGREAVIAAPSGGLSPRGNCRAGRRSPERRNSGFHKLFRPNFRAALQSFEIADRRIDRDDIGIFLVHVEQIDRATGLVPVEHAFFDDLHLEPETRGLDHGGTDAATGAFSRDKQRIDMKKIELRHEWRSPKGGGCRLLQDGFAGLRSLTSSMMSSRLA